MVNRIMNVGEALQSGIIKLRKVRIDSYQLDTELLLAKALFHPEKPSCEELLGYVKTIDRQRLYALSRNHKITNAQQRVFKRLIQQRSKRVPIAYLTNVKEFFGLPFYVDNRVLIPRPQTELLVEKTLSLHTCSPAHLLTIPTTIIDIGTGSGCIIVSITKEILRQAQNDRVTFIAADTDSAALKVAKINARIHGVPDTIKFIKTSSLPNVETGHLIIVANLPYLDPILKSKLIRATPELQFEPQDALFTPNHGLKHYIHLIQQLKQYQKKHINVTCFFEIDPHQRSVLSQKIKDAFHCSSSHHEGVVSFTLSSNN